MKGARVLYVCFTMMIGSSVACASILGDFEVVGDKPTSPVNDGSAPTTDAPVTTPDTGTPGKDGSADADATPPPPSFVATSISAGRNHTCAISAGDVWCWGNNQSGQLGQPGSGTPGGISDKPLRVPNFGKSFTGSKEMVTVVAGGNHTCSVDIDGAAWCWGGNDSMQLGISAGGDANPHPVPAQVKSGANTLGGISITNKVAAISAGDKHTCAVTSAGDVYCWGSNADGQITGAMGGSVITTKVSGVSNAQTVSVDGKRSCVVLLQGGGINCWGRDELGDMGPSDGGVGQIQPPHVLNLSVTPLQVATGGERHTCFVATTHNAFCFGANALGQLGHDFVSDAGFSSFPLDVTTPDSGVGTAASIQTGGAFTCGYGTGFGLGCWGANAHGQLGIGSTDVDRHPIPAPVPNTLDTKTYSLGFNHACLIKKGATDTDPGPVFCWGEGSFGKLGLGSLDDKQSPTQLD